MLTVVSGPYAGLENAFLERVRELKKDPLAPVAVVAPSFRMVERLQKLVADAGLAVLNVHFHTFNSFAETVSAEAPLLKPVFSDPLFFDTLVRQIIKEDKPFQSLDELALPEGFPPAVRGTLRDLLDAGINEANVAEAVAEEFAGQPVDLGTLRSLLQLYRLYLKRIDALPVFPRTELVKRAIELAESSKTLRSFKEILYYGFYDTTGLQADFFQLVAKHQASRFFFPYVRDHAAYAFAKRFRDTFVQPVMRDEIVLDPAPRETPAAIWNVSGVRDEAWLVATEILRLHDQEGIPFAEIAVIARAESRLRHSLPGVLADRKIPFHSAAPEMMSTHPLMQAAIGYLERQETGPEKDAWSGFAARTRASLDLFFETAGPADPRIQAALLAHAEAMSKFDMLGKPVARKEFLDALRERWSRLPLPERFSAERGVSLLYAEAARGLPFQAVFLIGLEEKAFPRIIREDPFLRDDARLALNLTLGHKINQKMTALEEERLLFELFVTAATKRLILIYQRSDDDGGVVGPSPFLRAFAEQRGMTLDKSVTSLPRLTLGKIQRADPFTLGARDVVKGFLSAGRNKEAVAFSRAVGEDGKALETGLKVQALLHSFSKPGPYDGLVGPRTTSDLFRDGKISATALEVYGLCPYKYFASRLLELEPPEDRLIDESLAGDKKGTSIHDFLEVFYRRVTADGSQPLPEKFPDEIYDGTYDSMIGALTAADVNLHPLLWRATKINLKEALRAYVLTDFIDCRQTGFRPAHFEAGITTELEPPLDGYQWIGKIDRIDRSGDAARIVDYKTGRPPKTKNVAALALKGLKTQAPLYILLAQKIFAALHEKVNSISFAYSYLSEEGSSVLTAGEWAAARTAILSAIKRQVALLHAGNFIMMPGDYCSYCEVASACRVNHGVSVYRSRQGAGEALWDLRETKSGAKK